MNSTIPSAPNPELTTLDGALAATHPRDLVPLAELAVRCGLADALISVRAALRAV